MQQEEQQTEHHSQDTQPVLWSLANGLQVVCLPLKYVEYVAADIILPGGVINDPEGKAGSSLLLAELLSRGVGTMSSQELLTAFDDHGIRHGESGSSLSLSLRSSFLPQETKRALELMSMMLREPSFPEEAVDPVKALFLHDLRSVRENPSRWAMLELSNRYFPAPFNKSPLGEEEDILSLTQSALKEQWFGRFGPKGAVLSVAGRVDVDELKGAIEQYFSPWKGECEEIPELTEFPKRRSVYLNYPGAQQQLLFRYPSPPLGTEHYYAAKVFSQILSGGMFGRLFIEVREKRGLCYSVYAQHSGRPEYGSFTVYAGTTPERVNETHDVIADILANPLSELTKEELDRAKNNLLSQIVLGEESTSSRSRSNASDWLLLKRIRSLAEIQSAVAAVDEGQLHQFLQSFPLAEPARLTLGSNNFGSWPEEALEIEKTDSMEQ